MAVKAVKIRPSRTADIAVSRQAQHHLSAAEMVAVAQTYQSGSTMKQLAANFHVNRKTVRLCLDRLGIPIRSLGLQPADRAQVSSLYQSGWSLAKLGDRFDCDPETVRKYLLEAGVQTRRPWERP